MMSRIVFTISPRFAIASARRVGSPAGLSEALLRVRRHDAADVSAIGQVSGASSEATRPSSGFGATTRRVHSASNQSLSRRAAVP